MDYVNGITFTNNVVAAVVERETFAVVDMVLDKRGGVIVCGMYGWESCTGNSLTDNIVAGAYYGGFLAPGIICDSGDTETFYNNVAHSVVGVGAGVYPNPSVSAHESCYEASYFSAYKN